MDRNKDAIDAAWDMNVALRKESVDRNLSVSGVDDTGRVALRKESVDRNNGRPVKIYHTHLALRKESVDRNLTSRLPRSGTARSLSARRAWIEIAES